MSVCVFEYFPLVNKDFMKIVMVLMLNILHGFHASWKFWKIINVLEKILPGKKFI